MADRDTKATIVITPAYIERMKQRKADLEAKLQRLSGVTPTFPHHPIAEAKQRATAGIAQIDAELKNLTSNLKP